MNLKKHFLSILANVLKKLRLAKITKNETINIKGVRYPVDQLLGYSQQKIDDILLRQAQLTHEQYQLTLRFLDELRSNRR